jgi:hypothetical protein
MCKEMPVIPVNKAVDPKRIVGKKWRAKEEERHKGSLTKKKFTHNLHEQILVAAADGVTVVDLGSILWICLG